MKKYTLTFTDNETGETKSLDCEAFFGCVTSDANRDTVFLQNVSATDIAVSMAASKELRQAARIAVAMVDAKQIEDAMEQNKPVTAAFIRPRN